MKNYKIKYIVWVDDNANIFNTRDEAISFSEALIAEGGYGSVLIEVLAEDLD